MEVYLVKQNTCRFLMAAASGFDRYITSSPSSNKPDQSWSSSILRSSYQEKQSEKCTHWGSQLVHTKHWQVLPIRKQLYTNMVLLNPVEQTIKSEAGPVGSIITPPETDNEAFIHVIVISQMWSFQWGKGTDLSTWRTLCPTLEKAAAATDSVRPEHDIKPLDKVL